MAPPRIVHAGHEAKVRHVHQLVPGPALGIEMVDGEQPLAPVPAGDRLFVGSECEHWGRTASPQPVAGFEHERPDDLGRICSSVVHGFPKALASPLERLASGCGFVPQSSERRRRREWLLKGSSRLSAVEQPHCAAEDRGHHRRTGFQQTAVGLRML